MKALKVTLFAAMMSVLALGTLAHAAGDVDAGKAKAKSCAGCHGAKGEGKKSGPALAGDSEEKFTEAMSDFKSGKRKNAAMNRLASKLTDSEIADLAAYYASLKK